jgi:hypothetical protein
VGDGEDEEGVGDGEDAERVRESRGEEGAEMGKRAVLSGGPGTYSMMVSGMASCFARIIRLKMEVDKRENVDRREIIASVPLRYIMYYQVTMWSTIK